MSDLLMLARRSKGCALQMAMASTEAKNRALLGIITGLRSGAEEIYMANLADINFARSEGMSESLIDRLSLQGRLDGLIADLECVLALSDPIGEIFEEHVLPNGLQVVKKRTPIGVIGVIYESRPNVTLDVAALAIKSGNCAILRGGSETLRTNRQLVTVIQEALRRANLPESAIQLISSGERREVAELLRLYEFVDLIIPRGGAALHRFCRENSAIPVITGGIGVCHLFVDASADLARSLPVIMNAKTQRPTVCNALDTLLVHRGVATSFIPMVVEALGACGVSFRCDEESWGLLNHTDLAYCQRAEPEDWDTEWCRLVLSIKVVGNAEEAMAHIAHHSTGHSDGILTADQDVAEKFLNCVDSAAVYHNASTRFTDGGQLGLGAEVAISTQKLHARGPMGLRELTSYKWIIRGDYAIRKS